MARKIALEEHFLAPGFEDYWRNTVTDVPAPARRRLRDDLLDLEARRIETMDASGIEKSILSLAGPGVQIEQDVATALRRAREANDYLAEAMARRPARYGGFAHLPMQDPQGAVAELARCTEQLGFQGAMINGQTLGRYLDHRDYDVFWEKAEELGTPIYIHPADPIRQPESFADYNALTRATWGWTVETASHALRLVFGGVFDRFPKASVVLGHMGETLPYLLWRLDSRAALYGVELRRKPSDYIRENVFITISGVYSQEPLDCALAALGEDRILFAADYPFELSETAAGFLDRATLRKEVRESIAFGNARRLFPNL